MITTPLVPNGTSELIAPEHPAQILWVDQSRRRRVSKSVRNGDRTLWSTTEAGGYITWEQFVRFIGPAASAALCRVEGK